MTDIKDKPEIKLPLFGYVGKLEPIPGQDADRTFAVANNITPAPEGSAGYLVELTGKRRCKILAWLRGGGDAFACDEPISVKPDRKAEVYMRLEPDRPGHGGVFTRLGGEAQVASRVHQLSNSNYRTIFLNPVCNLGPYADRELDTDDTLAVAFLAFYQLPLERGNDNPWATIADVLDKLTESSFPDALDALMYCGSKDSASGFEKLAAKQLTAAGAERVRAIAARHDIGLRRLASTRLFWTAYQPGELLDEEVDVLQAVEGALNRLAMVDKIFEGEDGSRKLGTLSEEVATAAACATLTHFLDVAPNRLRFCEAKNPFATINGVDCERGGEWDARTRFAASAEKLHAPFNFLYTFTCDARAGMLEVHASLPAERAFPASDEAEPPLVRTTYALRLSALLASVAFGSSVGIVRARVVLHERTEKGPTLMALTFSRQAFTMDAIPAIDALKHRPTGLSPDELLALFCPVEQEFSLGEDGGLLPLEVAESLVPRGPAMKDDLRQLPEELATVLHADRVCDLDIYDTEDDNLRDRMGEVFAEYQPGDPESIPALCDIIAALDAADMLEDDTRKPLYCTNMVCRILAGTDSDPALEATAPARFRKLPDTAFDARSALARTYREVGNFEDALRVSNELVELAPTTPSSWHTLALTYTEMGELGKAAETLVRALKVASAPDDVNVLYYRLGYTFWQLGDAPLGLACYTMIQPWSRFADQAASEMRDLMEQEHIAAIPSHSKAQAMLRSSNVPLAPTDSLRERTAWAAIKLTDAGFYHAAKNLVLFMAGDVDIPNARDILTAVASSLQEA